MQLWKYIIVPMHCCYKNGTKICSSIKYQGTCIKRLWSTPFNVESTQLHWRDPIKTDQIVPFAEVNYQHEKCCLRFGWNDEFLSKSIFPHFGLFNGAFENRHQILTFSDYFSRQGYFVHNILSRSRSSGLLVRKCLFQSTRFSM